MSILQLQTLTIVFVVVIITFIAIIITIIITIIFIIIIIVLMLNTAQVAKKRNEEDFFAHLLPLNKHSGKSIAGQCKINTW